MKCEIDFHNGALARSEQNSLSGYCQYSSRSPAIILRYKWSIWTVPMASSQTTMRIIKCRSGWSRVHLVWFPDPSLSEFRSKQAMAPLWKPISPWGFRIIMAARIITSSRALIAIPRTPLITSFRWRNYTKVLKVWSIPTLSTLTKWDLTKREVDNVGRLAIHYTSTWEHLIGWWAVFFFFCNVECLWAGWKQLSIYLQSKTLSFLGFRGSQPCLKNILRGKFHSTIFP